MTAATTAIVAGVKKSIDETTAYADEVDKASIRMNISAEAYQKLAYAAEQSGVEMSTLEKAAKKLEGTDLNMEDALNQIMALGTAEERSARASELFGDSIAYTLSPLIEQSGDDFQALTKRAEDLGLVLSGADVKAGVKLGDSMADVEKSIKMVVVQLGAKLVPVIQNIVDKVIPKLSMIFNIIEELWPVIENMINELWPMLEQLAEEVIPIIQMALREIVPILTEICSFILPIIIEILEAILPILQPILKLLSPILHIVEALISPLVDILVPIISVIANALAQLFDWLAPMLEGVADFFGNIPTYAKAALNGVIKFLNGFIDGLNALLAPLRLVISAIAQAFGADWGFGDVKIPHIPMLAKGGFLTSGSAIVGEAGPELLSVFGGGAKVQPLTNNTNNYALGGVTINVTQTDGEDSVALANRISEMLAEQYDRQKAVFA